MANALRWRPIWYAVQHKPHNGVSYISKTTSSYWIRAIKGAKGVHLTWEFPAGDEVGGHQFNGALRGTWWADTCHQARSENYNEILYISSRGHVV